MKKSKREKIIEYLKKDGFKIMNSINSKYVIMMRTPKDKRKYFIGIQGMLRVGKTLQNSTSLTNMINKYICND